MLTPLRQFAHVPSLTVNGAMTKSPGRRVDLGADLLDDADELVPDAMRLAWSVTPRYGHRSEPHTQAATTRTMASPGSWTWIGDVFESDVAGAVDDRRSHIHPSFGCGTSPSLIDFWRPAAWFPDQGVRKRIVPRCCVRWPETVVRLPQIPA